MRPDLHTITGATKTERDLMAQSEAEVTEAARLPLPMSLQAQVLLTRALNDPLTEETPNA